MITHTLGNSEINSIPEWRVFLLNKRKSWRQLLHSNREIKEIFDPEKLTLSINSEHKSAKKNHGSSFLPYSLPLLWKLATLTIFDHATWQHPRENPRHVRGAAQIYDVRMAQFVLKIEKLSHIMGPRASQDLRSPSPIMAPEYTNVRSPPPSPTIFSEPPFRVSKNFRSHPQCLHPSLSY